MLILTELGLGEKSREMNGVRGGMKRGTPMGEDVHFHDRWDAFSIHRFLYAASDTSAVHQTDRRQRGTGWAGSGCVSLLFD